MHTKKPYTVYIPVFFFSLFLAGGCTLSHQKVYSGPELQTDKTALIETGSIGINLENLDGIKVRALSLSVLPGEHSVEMSFSDEEGDIVYYSTDNCILSFTAKAGRSYRVDKTISGNIYGGVYNAFVADRDSGERTGAGCSGRFKTHRRQME